MFENPIFWGAAGLAALTLAVVIAVAARKKPAAQAAAQAAGKAGAPPEAKPLTADQAAAALQLSMNTAGASFKGRLALDQRLVDYEDAFQLNQPSAKTTLSAQLAAANAAKKPKS